MPNCPQCGGEDLKRIDPSYTRDPETGYLDCGPRWQCYDCLAVSTEEEMEKANVSE